MPRELFPHQENGAQFLVERDTAGLFFGMGTGKTLTSLEAAKRVSADRVVVVGPPISLPMWVEEANNWRGPEHDAYHLKTGKDILTTIAPQTTVVVSYAIATTRAKELGQWLSEGKVSVVILDESHNLKNHKAKRTIAILGRGGMTDGNVDHLWFMTGTPITRWNDDLYPFLARADLDGLKEHCGGAKFDRFQRKFTVSQLKQYSKKMRPAYVTVSNRNTDVLANWTYSGLAMRVDLKDVYKDMPPLTINTLPIDLDRKAMGDEAYARLKALEKTSMSAIQKAANAADPALGTIRRELGIGKVKAAAAEIADRVESGQSVLVGAWHNDVIDNLCGLLSKYGVRAIRGGVSKHHREESVDLWNDGKLRVLVGQIAAMGVSLNLQQGGSQIVVVEADWSPTVMDQFYARLWRYGQEQHVHVDILSSGTKLEEAMGRSSADKAQQAEKHNQIGRDLAAAIEEEKNNGYR